MKSSAFFFSFTLTISASSHAATIAVLDSGVLPFPEAVPFIEAGGIDVDTGGMPIDDDPDLHGTQVSFVAVAVSDFTARILPVKVRKIINQPKAIDFASTDPRVKILNLSWIDAVFHVPTVDALVRAVNRGKLVVMAAGNSSRPDPDFPAGVVHLLKGRGLAVGAIGGDGNLRPYSARAGRLKDHYVVAPDGFTGLGGQLLTGTSFAAPVVSGLAALLLEQSPFLSARDLASIIKRTTIDLGAPGVDAIYGHGLVTLAALSAPVGATRLASGDSVDGGAVTLSAQTLRGSPAFAYALLDRSNLLGETMILDEYKRAFVMDLATTIDVAENRTALNDLINSRFFESVDLALGHSKLTLRYAPTATPTELFAYPDEDYGTSFEDLSLSLFGVIDAISFRLDTNARSGAGFGSAGLHETALLFSDRVFDAPYLSFAKNSTSMSVGYGLNDKFTLRFGTDLTDESDAHGLKSLSDILRAEYQATDRLNLGVQAGRTVEQGSLYGGTTGGVFAVDTAETNFVGLSARYRLSSNFELAFRYSEGSTAVDESANSLLRNLDDLRSRTYGMALLGRDLFTKRDRFGVAVYSPLRVKTGSASLSVPRARDIPGNVLRGEERVNLTPAATETDVELFYRVPLGRRFTLDTQFLYQHNPYHTHTVDDRVAVFSTFRTRF